MQRVYLNFHLLSFNPTILKHTKRGDQFRTCSCLSSMCFNMVSATYSHKPRYEWLPCPYLLGAGKTHTYVLPFRMNSPKGGRYEYLRLLTLVLSRLLDNRRRAGDTGMRDRIWTDGLTVLQTVPLDRSGTLIFIYWRSRGESNPDIRLDRPV